MSAPDSREWTAEEIARMKSEFPAVGAHVMATRLARSLGSVRRRAYNLGLTTLEGEWSAADLAVLRRDFRSLGAAHVAALVGRSYRAVRSKVHRMGLVGGRQGKRPGGNSHTDRALAAIIAAGAAGLATPELRALHVGTHARTYQKTAQILVSRGEAFGVGFREDRRYFACSEDAARWDANCNPVTLQRSAKALAREAALTSRERERVVDVAPKAPRPAKPAKPPGTKGRFWTDAETAQLRALYPTRGALHCAEVLGRTNLSIRVRAQKLGLVCLVYVRAPIAKPAGASTDAPKAPRKRVRGTHHGQGANRIAEKLRRDGAPKTQRKGPFAPDAPVTFHPNFKFTRAPAPPAALRTNTYPVF